MKKFSIAMLLVLTSCNSLIKHKDEFKPIVHDMVDEEIDKAAEGSKPVVIPPAQKE